MSLIRWNPITPMLSGWPDLWDEDLISTVGGNNNLDVFETGDEVVVRANVAGVGEKDIDLTFEKGVLWIKAEKTEEKDDTAKKHYSKSTWNYSYRVAVPGFIDHGSEPKAEIEDGVITVTFKKSEASKPKKLTVTKVAKS